MAETAQLITYRACPASPEDFVAFWSGQYRDPREPLYTDNIGRPLNAERVIHLFIWKNGGKLSALKQRSVEQNFTARIGELQRLPDNTTAADFLRRFSFGGAIWRIFWLHCWQPDRFPIYDQHVHRAMTFIEKRQPEELAEMADEQKIQAYLNRYLPFHRRFDGLDRRDVDRALWAYGKFIKNWWFPVS